MAETPILKIPQVAPNQQSKEATINDGFSIMERSLNDIRGVNLASGNVEINETDYTRAFLFNAQGHSVARELTVPASKRLFGVFNAGTGVVTVKAKDSTGLTADCPVGSFCIMFNDGEDIRLISDSAASGQVSAFLSLPDTPASFAGHAGEAIVVNGTEDALEFGTISVSFTQLTDSPANYSGAGGQIVRVNTGETGIEFDDYIANFSQLNDTPSDYISQAGRMLVVNPGETGLTFTDVPEPVIMATRVFDLPNGQFELGDFTHWIVPVSPYDGWVVDSGYFALEPVIGSNFAIFAAEQGTEPSSIAYEIDLLDVAYPEEIDDDAEIVVEIFMGSMTEDFGSIEVEFLDEADQFIDSATSPQYIGTQEMIDRRFRTEVPEGARKAIIYLEIQNNIDGEDPDNLTFAFDYLRVELKLVVDQINTLIQLFDTPLSYENQAGRMLVVNGEEDGMEFQDTPQVRDAFTQLNDTPVNYNDAGERYLRVNDAANAIEFIVPSFLHFGDTPASFGGQSGRYLRVNTGENALEFTDEPSGGVETLEDLDDVAYPDPPEDGWVLTYDNGMWIAAEPTGGGSAEYPDLTGNAFRYLRVNAGEDDVEWADPDALVVDTRTESFTLALSDIGKYIRVVSATPVAITVPDNATVNFPPGSQVVVRQVGAGQVTFVEDGVTITTPETLSLRKAGSSVSLINAEADLWDLTGDLEIDE